MLRFLTKEDFWSELEAGCLDTSGWDADRWATFSIKQIQDAILLHMLRDAKDLDILEVGGGRSRTLPTLCRNNRCTNADPVEGSGHGPVGVDADAVPWRHVFRAMGDTDDALAPASFDIVYSISVVEHVNDVDLPAFFDDIARVLRPGGRMLHLIDSYLADPDGDNADARRRATHYRQAFAEGSFFPVGDVLEDAHIHFRGAYATNPDLVMHTWNQMAPRLRATRSAGQACSFLMDAKRVNLYERRRSTDVAACASRLSGGLR